jgi:hypothetical protein
MVDVMAERPEAEKTLRAAVEKTFGPQGVRLLLQDTQSAIDESFAKLDKAREDLDGENAKVTGPDDGSELVLKRVDGSWKIPVMQFSSGNEHEVQERLEDQKLAITLIRETTDEITAGRYKTPEEASEAIKVKVMVAAAKRAAASSTTGPSTVPSNPATRPS